MPLAAPGDQAAFTRVASDGLTIRHGGDDTDGIGQTPVPPHSDGGWLFEHGHHPVGATARTDEGRLAPTGAITVVAPGCG